MARRSVQLFQSRPPSATAPSTNREGYPAFVRSLEEQAVQTLVCNTLRNTFYVDAKDLLKEAGQVHDAMLAKDPEFFAKALVYARNRGFMRTQPIYGLVKLARVRPDLFRKVFDKIIRTPNDLADFSAILRSERNGEGGSAIKKAAGRWLTNLDEYRVIKYGSDKKPGSYSLRDMLQVYHPKTGKASALFDYVMGGKVVKTSKEKLPSGKVRIKVLERSMDGIDFGKLPKIEQFELLKRSATDDEKVQAIALGELPHEVATSFAGDSLKVWDAIVPQMPIFALLRNLKTLEKHGVLEKNRKIIEDTLTNRETILRSKILPFRFMEARKHVKAAWAQDALREALELSFDNVPDLVGRTLVACDCSGSMGPGYSGNEDGFIKSASIFAIALMKKAKNNGRFVLFNHEVHDVTVSMRDSILTQAERIKASGGTDHSVVMNDIIARLQNYDNIVYITDEQQNMGSPLMDRIQKYRERVNKNAKLMIVDLSPYRNALLPEHALNTYVYGWSDAALQFVSYASRGWGDMVQHISSTQLETMKSEEDQPQAAL